MRLIDRNTKELMEECKSRARDFGLQFPDDTLEYIVSNQDMVDLQPKVMIPTMYDFWLHDVDIHQGRGKYQFYPHNPMETVINTFPPISFYNNDNPDWMNKFIFYHVLGHIDFFRSNKFFEDTWNDDICGKALSHKRRINEIRKEMGEDKRWVDYVIEFTRQIDNLVNIHKKLRNQNNESESKKSEIDFYLSDFLKEKDITSHEYMNEVEEYNSLVREYGEETARISFIKNKKKEYSEFQSVYNRYLEKSEEKEDNLIDFLMNNSSRVNRSGNEWMKEIMQIVKETSEYLEPQRFTKILNEGWACIVGDSLVHTEDGFVPIKDAQEYCKQVVGVNDKLTDIGDICLTEKINTVKIKTNRFFNLEGAENHGILVVDNDGELEDVMLKDLNIGDKVKISAGNDIWPKEKVKIDRYTCFQKQLLFPKRQKNVDIPEYVDEDIGYLFGSLIAEGCWLGRGLAFKNSDEDYAERIKEILEKKFNTNVNMSTGPEGKIDVSLYSTMVLEFMKQAGMDIESKSHNKRVPWSILQSPRNVVANFLAGFTDGDGCVHYNGRNSRSIILVSKSEKLLEEIALLLSNFGIIGSYGIGKKEGYEDVYRLSINSGLNIKSFYENIPLRDQKKLNLLEESVLSIKQPRNIDYTAEVIDISYGKAVNYDWEIPDGNYYAAQGFVNHNTLVHTELFLNDRHLQTHESDFAKIHSAVVQTPEVGLNPYAIGYNLLNYIRDLGNRGKLGYEFEKIKDFMKRDEYDDSSGKGLETLFSIRENLDDFQFLNFLDNINFQEFVDYYRLYVTGRRLDPEEFKWKYYVKSRNGEDYRNMIVDKLPHPPNIQYDVIDDDLLHLDHIFEGKQLHKPYIENVLRGIYYFWENPVILVTNDFKIDQDEYMRWVMGYEDIDYKIRKMEYVMDNDEFSYKEVTG